MSNKRNPNNPFMKPMSERTLQIITQKVAQWALYLSQNPEARCPHRKRRISTIGSGYEMESALVPTGNKITKNVYVGGQEIDIVFNEFYCNECGERKLIQENINSFEDYARTNASIMELALLMTDMDSFYRMAVDLKTVASGEALVLGLTDQVGSWSKAQGLEYLKEASSKANAMYQEAKSGNVAAAAPIDASVISKAISLNESPVNVYSYVKADSQVVTQRDLFTNEAGAMNNNANVQGMTPQAVASQQILGVKG